MALGGGGGGWPSAWFAVQQIRGSKLNYALGLLSCIVVVFTVATLFTVLQNSALVFVRLAELTAGEVDLRLRLVDGSPHACLNFSALQPAVTAAALPADVAASFAVAPRWSAAVRVVARSRCSEAPGNSESRPDLEPASLSYGHGLRSASESASGARIDSRPGVGDMEDDGTDADLRWRYFGARMSPRAHCYVQPDAPPFACFIAACADGLRPGAAATATLLAIDIAAEAAGGFGRSFGVAALGVGEVALSSALADALGAGVGDVVYLPLQLPLSAAAPWARAVARWRDSAPHAEPDVGRFGDVLAAARVAAVFSLAGGKLPVTSSNVVVAEIASLTAMLAENVNPDAPASLRAEFGALPLAQYASEFVANVLPSRNDVYGSSDLDVVRRALVVWASQMLYPLDYSQFATELPIADRLAFTAAFEMFIGLVLNVVVMILVGLSVLLIYSLLLVNVETKAFDLGVLRMVGASRSGLVALLSLQAISYGLPAWLIGLLLAQAATVVVALALSLLSGASMSPWISLWAFGWATGLAFLTPLVASVIPTFTALGVSLSESLDARRGKVQAVVVTVERSESGSFSWSLLVIGAMLSLFGFGVYYLFPLALITANITLLMNLFLGLLVGMLLGLVVITLNLEFLFERVFVALFLFWEARSVRTLIRKNGAAHRPRNAKTAVLFAVSVAFIVFVVITYDTSISAFLQLHYQEKGALVESKLIMVDADSTTGRSAGMPIDILENEVLSVSPYVKAWSWVTLDWRFGVYSTGAPSIGNPVISNLGRTYQEYNAFLGVSPNLYAVTVSSMASVEDEDEALSSTMTLPEQLYTESGGRAALTGALYRTELGLAGLDDEFLVQFSLSPDALGRPRTALRRTHAQAFMTLLPGFTMSDFPQIRQQNLVVSHPSYLRMLLSSGADYRSVRDMPMQRLLVKMRGEADDETHRVLLAHQMSSAIRTILPAGSTIEWTIDTVAGPIAVANTVLFFFFAFSMLAALVVSSFALVSSTVTNIHEQLKEIAILRALGLSRFKLVRVYVYESLFLVLASTLLGALVGAAVSYTLVLQRVLFTHFPIPFDFPWAMVLLTIVLASAVSVIAALLPILRVLRMSLVQMLK